MAEQLLFKQKLNVLVPQLHNSSHNSPNASASFSLIIFFVGTPPPQKSKKMHARLKNPLSLLPPLPFRAGQAVFGASFWESIALKECLPCSPEV